MSAARFATAIEWQIGRYLAISPRTQAEIIELIGADKKTVRKALAALEEKELLTFHPSASDHVGRGHPRGMWSLRGEGPDRPLGYDTVPSEVAYAWRPGQTWVAATVPVGQLADFMSVLARPDLAAAASWVVQLDGDGRTAFFAFEPQLGTQPADRLTVALRSVGLECVSGTVRAVDHPEAAGFQARSVVCEASD